MHYTMATFGLCKGKFLHLNNSEEIVKPKALNNTVLSNNF